MKLFPNLVKAVVEVLSAIFEKNVQADKAIQNLLKSNPKWGSRDRRFLAETSYSVVRWYRLYYEILGHVPISQESWWKILGIHWVLQGETLPPFPEFTGLDVDEIKKKRSAFKVVRKINESIPDWLDTLGEQELGQKWTQCIHHLNSTQCVNLRVNTIKTTKKACLEALNKEGINTENNEELCISLPDRPKLAHLKSHQQGWYEIQDQGSQLIAPFLNPEPGSLVVDACAGAGGKSLHLASLMNNKGQIVAMDVHHYKLKELNKRAARAGVHILTTKLISDHALNTYENKADYLLLDVPCSGTGTLKRNPGAKWRLTLDFIDQIKDVQQSIITAYSKMVKEGGLMVYATCSILPSENEEQVHSFLSTKSGKAFELIKQQSIFPELNQYDGFFMALLRKTKA